MKNKGHKNEFAHKIDKYISDKVRDTRLRCGITQQELGKEIDVSIQQIQKYEKAVNRISMGKLAGIAKALGKPLEYFCNSCEINNVVAMKEAENPREKFANEMIKKFLKIRNLEQQNAVVNLIDSLIKQ